MKATGKVGRGRLRWIVVGCGLILLAGCGQQPAAAMAPSKPATAAPTAAPRGALTEGMAYADLRATVLSKGWKPKADAQCKANVVGGNFAELCKHNPDQCKVCDDVPELSSCSGDGHCVMNFERGEEEVLSVSTYGEISDWHGAGKASGLYVKWWNPKLIEVAVTNRQERQLKK
jgi:hypothetical protein